MAGLDAASQAPDGLAPVPVPARGPSGPVALGVVAVALVALVGIALVGRSGGEGPGSEAAVDAPTGTVLGTPAATASPTDRTVATPSPTAPLAPSGTPPPRAAVAAGPLPTCPPGSTSDEPGPVDQSRPAEVSAMAFDRRAARLVALTGPDDVETWTFDVCTNTWTRMHPDREPPSGAVRWLVYDVDSDVTIASGSARMWAYDLGADTWTEKGSFAPFAYPELASLRFYDPVSGLVVALADDRDPYTLDARLWDYDVETDAWTPIRQWNRLADGRRIREVAYDASVDRVVAYTTPGPAEAETWLFDLRTGTWSGTGAVTPEFSYGWWGTQPTAAYDEAAQRTVMLGQGHSASYDAGAYRWETLYESPSEGPIACGTRPECRQMPQVAYDAVNERLVAYGGNVFAECTWEVPDDMWAFDMATRSWSLIVPPTPGPPPLLDLARGGAAASTGPDRSPWIRAANVMLHGGPFFTRVAGVADGGPSSSTPPAAPSTIVDGLFLPECQEWTEGTVWWEETTSDPSSRAWIEIDLGGAFALDAAVVQADVNDEYRLSYRDPKTAAWTPLWDVSLGEAGGMATRPVQGDASERWTFPQPVVTNALRFEATSGDAQYSVSEIAVFGKRAH